MQAGSVVGMTPHAESAGTLKVFFTVDVEIWCDGWHDLDTKFKSAFDALNSLIVPTVLIIGIMYFLMIRPQQRRLKEHQAMIAAIRRGDIVVTSGGIIGKVAKVDDNELQVEIAEGVRIKVVRGTVSEVRTKGEAPASPKSKAPAAEGEK